jgi:hypothetical protein
MPKKEMPDLASILSMPDTKVTYQSRARWWLKAIVAFVVVAVVAYIVVAPWADRQMARCQHGTGIRPVCQIGQFLHHF